MTKEATEQKDTPTPSKLGGGLPLEKVSTAKFRMLSPEGVAVEYFIFATTDPEEIENLIDQTGYAITQLQEAGSIVANAVAAGKSIAAAGASALKEKFGIRDANELFHCISLDIDPQRDGRVKASFFGNDFKQPRDDYAQASLLLSPEDIQQALGKYHEFKLETLQKIGTFSVDFYVETYLSSKMNSKGKPYKNVPKGGIHVADGREDPAIAVAPPPPQPPPPQPPQPEAPQQPDDIPF